MFYTTEEIIKNQDDIKSFTIDVYSIHQAFIKLLKLSDRIEWTEELRNELLINHFETNRTYSKVLDKFALYLAKALFNIDIWRENEITEKFNNVKKYLTNNNEEQVISEMKEIFTFLKLKGKAQDIENLVTTWDLFSDANKTKVLKTSFNFEPVSGCDLPE
ncbi:hypothetical protein [Mycoplasma hafezii]|uniref:hypothetical protein n=1 Tax=Mycoplasma hafezii TaxID=525886 RepID=UPI003CEA4956